MIFKCYVVRRADAFNTPWILNRPKDQCANSTVRFSSIAPLDNPILEQRIITMPQLAKISDLSLKIQSICGIQATNMIICSAEENIASKEKDGSVVRRRTELTSLTNKKGPCTQLLQKHNIYEESSSLSASPMMRSYKQNLRKVNFVVV